MRERIKALFARFVAWIEACWQFIVGQHAFAMEKGTRNAIGVAFLGGSILATWLTIKVLRTWAILKPDPDSPAWELALQSRLILFRAKAALGLALASIILAWVVFQILDRTRLGKRLWHWSPAADSEGSSSAKTLVAGGTFAALLVGFLLLSAQVLR